MAMTEIVRLVPLRDSSLLQEDAQGLRERAEADGYLYFAGLLPPGIVLGLRERILQVCQARKWLEPGRPVMEGVARHGLTHKEGPDPEWQGFYRDVLCLREFHGLAMHPDILRVLERLFGETPVPHSRNICRVVFPGSSEYTTPPHQDHLYIGGTRETWTVWIPLGDCPEALGGLAVAPGTHRLGFLESQPAKGPGGRQVAVPEDTPWAAGAFRCGDVIMLHSLTIHQGRDNTTPDRLRVSCDFRYQPLSHPIRRDSMEPHMAGFGLTWDDIYAAWDPTDPLRYYWRQWDLHWESQGD